MIGFRRLAASVGPGRGRADVISRMLAVISYRRADSQDIAGRIGDHLRRRFGDSQVFLDTGSIPAGADFRHTIQEAMRRRGVLVAIVGPDWIGARNGTTNRIHDHDDPVRMEVAAALANGLPIIPVLVNGASMPTANELPDDLKDFSYRNALAIDRGRNFHRDATILSARSKRWPRAASGGAGPSRHWRRLRRRWWSAGSPCRTRHGMACGARCRRRSAMSR
jgi:hypothetical protein